MVLGSFFEKFFLPESLFCLLLTPLVLAGWSRSSGSLLESGCHEQGSPAEKYVGQRTQRRELRRVFGQAFIAQLPVSPQMLDHSEGMLDLGPDPRMPVMAFLLG